MIIIRTSIVRNTINGKATVQYSVVHDNKLIIRTAKQSLAEHFKNKIEQELLSNLL